MSGTGEKLSALSADALQNNALAPGLVIDNRLRIEEYLGSGGMCNVYRATHLVLDRVTAVKFLKNKLTGERMHITRFGREAEILSKLKHPNIVEVFSVGQFGDQPYIAMEFVPGRSLSRLLSDRPHHKLAETEALPLFVQLCDALGEAHGQGIIHRDLKPSNVILTDNDRAVKLMDFGIAKFLPESQGDKQKLTQTGELIGSLAYMSPEQCEGASMDARSDIYSLGCLMYEVLTGAPPFSAESPVAVLMQHMESVVPRPKELRTRIGRIILRCLAKDPGERPANAAALKALLLQPTPERKEIAWKRVADCVLDVMVAGGLTFGMWYHSLDLSPVDTQSDKAAAETEPSPDLLRPGAREWDENETGGQSGVDGALFRGMFRRMKQARSHDRSKTLPRLQQNKQKYAKYESYPAKDPSRHDAFIDLFKAECEDGNVLYRLSLEKVSPHSTADQRLQWLNESLEDFRSAAQKARENEDMSRYELAVAEQARILSNAGRTQEALGAASIVLSSPPPSAQDTLAIAAWKNALRYNFDSRFLLHEASSYQAAAEQWLDFLKWSQGDEVVLADANLALARCAERQGQLEKAARIYENLPFRRGRFWLCTSRLGAGRCYIELAQEKTGAEREALLHRGTELLRVIAGRFDIGESRTADEILSRIAASSGGGHR